MNMQENLRTARIMIVDDDDDLRHVLLTQLEREGVAGLEQAETMAAAFDKIYDFDPDILILDVQLPDGNGFHICEPVSAPSFASTVLPMMPDFRPEAWILFRQINLLATASIKRR